MSKAATFSFRNCSGSARKMIISTLAPRKWARLRSHPFPTDRTTRYSNGEKFFSEPTHGTDSTFPMSLLRRPDCPYEFEMGEVSGGACRSLPIQRRFGEPHPVGRTERDRIVVKIISRMMQHGAVAVADIDERARTLFQHIGEVLGTHQRRRIAIDFVLAGNLSGDRSRKGGAGF